MSTAIFRVVETCFTLTYVGHGSFMFAMEEYSRAVMGAMLGRALYSLGPLPYTVSMSEYYRATVQYLLRPSVILRAEQQWKASRQGPFARFCQLAALLLEQL